jgi:hypothetical protein
MDLQENMMLHLIHTHGRALQAVTGRTYDDLKAEHDGLTCPPAPAGQHRHDAGCTWASCGPHQAGA